ncbi:hypothetical protein IWX49DRAFT_29040 [Phyllosticta citricarpa]
MPWVRAAALMLARSLTPSGKQTARHEKTPDYHTDFDDPEQQHFPAACPRVLIRLHDIMSPHRVHPLFSHRSLSLSLSFPSLGSNVAWFPVSLPRRCEVWFAYLPTLPSADAARPCATRLDSTPPDTSVCTI